MTAQEPPVEAASWRSLVRQNGTPEFAAAFTKDAILDASVLASSLQGADAIGRFFKATTTMYETLQFTAATTAGEKTYMEWAGTIFGRDVAGITVVARDASGLIRSVHLYHLPLEMVSDFAAELAKRMAASHD